MRRPASVLLPVLCLAWLGYAIFSAQQLRSQSGAQPEAVAQFRIIVGLTDSAAKPWQGEVTVTGAVLDLLSGWRFSQADRAEPSGKFEFHTKVAALENQLLPGQRLGQTDWSDARMQRLVPEGLRSFRVRSIRYSAGSFPLGAGGVPRRSKLERALLVTPVSAAAALAMDESARLYMALRSRTSAGTARIDYWANNGRWEAFLTHLDGDRWSPAVPITSSVDATAWSRR